MIDAASFRQMAHLRTYQIGPHAALSQQLLNEVSAARVCLLNSDKKAAYDALLREQLKPRESPPEQPASAPPLIVIPPPQPPYLKHRPKKRVSWPSLTAVCALVAIVGAVVFSTARPRQPAAESLARREERAVAKPDVAQQGSSTEPSNWLPTKNPLPCRFLNKPRTVKSTRKPPRSRPIRCQQ